MTWLIHHNGNRRISQSTCSLLTSASRAHNLHQRALLLTPRLSYHELHFPEPIAWTCVWLLTPVSNCLAHACLFMPCVYTHSWWSHVSVALHFWVFSLWLLMFWLSACFSCLLVFSALCFDLFYSLIKAAFAAFGSSNRLSEQFVTCTVRAVLNNCNIE